MAFNKVKALGEAEKLVGQGKISSAIKQYLHVIEKDPADYSLLNTLGDLYIRDKNIPEALKCFRDLAEQYVKDGFTVKAIAILKKVTKSEPDAPDPVAKLAGLYQVQGLTREAREQYFLLVDLYKKKGQNDAALSTLHTIVQLDPENTTARARVAMFCEQAGRTKEAALAYRETAEIALRRNDLATVGSALKKAKALEGETPQLRLLEARVAFAQQQLDQVERILTADPPLTDHPAGQQLLFEAYLGSSKLEAAEKLAATLYRANPADFTPVRIYENRCLEKGEPDAGLRLLAEIAEPLKEQKDAAPVMDALRQIWTKFPQHLPTLELIYQICERTADEFALPEILEALARAYDEAGELEKAESAYRGLLQREPENQHYQGLLNQVQKKQGKVVEAPLPAEAAPFEAAPPSAEAPPAAGPAAVPAPQAPADAAARLAMIKEALENSDLFARYGLVEKAVAELEKVLEVYPDAVEIHQRIMEICHRAKPERAAQASEALACLAAEKVQPESVAAAEQPPALEIKVEEPQAAVEAPVPSELALGGPEPAAPEAPAAFEFPPTPPPEAPPAEAHEEAAAPAAEIPLELEPVGGVAEQAAVPPPPGPELAEFDLSGDLEAFAAPPAPTPAPSPPPAPPTAKLEETLQEIEFYLANGFEDEAQRLLAEAENAFAGDPRLTELRRRVEEALKPPVVEAPQPAAAFEIPESLPAPSEVSAEVAGFTPTEPLEQVPEAPPPPPPVAEEWELPSSFAGTRPPAPPVAPPASPPGPVAAGPPAPAMPMAGGEDLLGSLASDLAGSLEGFGEAPAAPVPEAPPSPAAGEADSATLLSGLLEEMAEPGAAARDDPETHYNLGVAFREMGLLDEAIGEFQKVVRHAQKGQVPANFLQSCSLLAACFLEKKMPTIAAKWYVRALQTPGLDEETTMALYYELGLAYEEAGDFRHALENFTEVYSQNIDYRDVAEKIRLLQRKIS